ncbi:LysR substrate-binding domain-containing protein [Pararhodobacter sp.]|uniref:LysR substrate-binding domain-containing protein n=1 Tax=Pararhodobacter sp. TaxID=2127056 RepID=UPI002FE3EC6D|nr:LysR family transcriptional regulator [Pseudomonadota bacterium]
MTRDFSPREIEIFAAVMLHGTTTKAADSLEITQPAVSKALIHIADKAGFKLFRKVRQRLVPTPEAHILYAEVEKVFESARLISRTAREIRELRTGRLEITSLPAFGTTLLPEIVARFSELHPTLSIGVDIRATTTVIQRASRNQIDIGIGATLDEDNPSITRRSFASTPPVCVMPRSHPLAALPVVTLEDLQGQSFVSLASGDPMRSRLDQMCDARGIARNVKIESSLSGACLGLVAAGAGVAVVDRLSAWTARHLPIEIRAFEPMLDINLSIYRPWGVAASSVSEAFSAFLVQETRAYLQAVDEGIRRMAPDLA